MLSLLPLSAKQMQLLQGEFVIYGMPNGRINIAGLRSRKYPF
ncbi:hypothetical protein [Alteromonas lipotrueae]|nr:hypothetical protein [Alteromonas lipotrueae]